MVPAPGTVIRPEKWERWGRWVVLLLFVTVAAVTVFRHEMWRDEIRSWRAVSSADNPAELVVNVRAEAHPGLWVALLYPVNRVSSNPVAMQIVHVAIAIAVAGLVLFASPFPVLWRILFVFGYFPFFEYCVISRNYAAGALFLFLFCALYPALRRRPLAATGALFLLAQTSVYGLIFSTLLGLLWIVEGWKERGGGLLKGSGLTPWVASLWLSGICLSLVQLAGARTIIHPLTVEKTTDSVRVLRVLATPWRGYVPIPWVRFHFWNTNILDRIDGGDVLQVVLGLTMVGVFSVLFVRHRPVFLLYLFGSVGLVLFSFFFYLGHVRHHGHHFLLLLACLWIMLTALGKDGEYGTVLPRWGTTVVGGLLVVNVAAGLYAVGMDWRHTFSSGRQVARFIRSQGIQDLPVVGHRDMIVESVAGYLQKPLYYPSLGREASFIPWDSPRWESVDVNEAFRQAGDLASERNTDVLIVVGRMGKRPPKSVGGAKLVYGSGRTIVRDERFDLYLFRHPRRDPTGQ